MIRKTLIAGALGLASTALVSAAHAGTDPAVEAEMPANTTGDDGRAIPYEQEVAKSEEVRMVAAPIGGVENDHWFNYQANVNEARKELDSDLERASDIEDQREAWQEYAVQLRDERVAYAKKMADEGYPVGEVYVGG
jgi:hypothetical protein